MKKGFMLADILIILLVVIIVLLLILPSLIVKNKDEKIIDNTRIKQSAKIDKDCKIQTIEITDNGVSIKCKEY